MTTTLCSKCATYICYPNDSDQKSEGKDSTSLCQLCLGLWHHNSKDAAAGDPLETAIEKACEPYGGLSSNHFASLPNHGPTLTIAGDICLRYHALAAQQISKETEKRNTPKIPFSTYFQDLKNHLYNRLQRILDRKSATKKKEVPILSNREQQGYLSIHLLCLPSKGSVSYDDVIESQRPKKRQRQKFRNFTTQGGDPRKNLETRLKIQGYQWFSASEADTVLSHSSMATTAINNTSQPMEYQVAVFRRPIYLYGFYTKCRRDVSQTPFVVDGKSLSITSVEEQICGPISSLLGISDHNNPTPVSAESTDDTSRSQRGKIQYGMCKFHASGREDMDVRMLLRPGQTRGRPFCVQLIDALKPVQTQDQLDALVAEINCKSQGDTENEANKSTLWYGQNPLGVGVSDIIRLVPSEKFSGLQADTEEKVKHYGCHCWSEKELPVDWTFPGTIIFPTTIKQKTPLRVLHRRTNLIRDRDILQANARRLDEHHFRLELSTQAGTYVKEFVHGDLRRTQPSIASLLGCKTNLLLLDCEGIDVND